MGEGTGSKEEWVREKRKGMPKAACARKVGGPIAKREARLSDTIWVVNGRSDKKTAEVPVALTIGAEGTTEREGDRGEFR